MPLSAGDVITFGSTKVVHSTDGRSQQYSNPHAFVIDGLEELLRATPQLSRAGSTQRLTDPQADMLSQPSHAEEQEQPAAAVGPGEAADMPPPPPADPGAAQGPAMLLESTSPQEQEHEPGPAARTSSLHANGGAELPALLPALSGGRLEGIIARLRPPQSTTGRVDRPASPVDPSIIDLTEVWLRASSIPLIRAPGTTQSTDHDISCAAARPCNIQEPCSIRPQHLLSTV